MGREVIVRSTHRGLRYVDGRLDVVLEPGRYRLPRRIPFRRRAFVEVVLVDLRERELTIKGQEILTADKVAVRVSIITQFRVVDPVAAVERVADYPDRLYSDVQLAARRSLASMTLEAILSNLQDVMNRVLTAQRLAEAHLVEARTAAERGALEASARAEATQRAAQADAEATRIRAEAEVDALNRLSQAASAYAEHPALLRLRELETMAGLSANPAARLYIGFDKHRDQLPHNDR